MTAFKIKQKKNVLSPENENLIECSICLEKFDEDEHKPKILHCGHSLCLTCLDQYYNTDSFLCPVCKNKPSFKNSKDIPINYDFLCLMKGLGLI
jgi:hypothetical protein